LLDLRQARNYVPAPGRKLVSNGVRFAGPGVEAWLELLGAPVEFTFARPAEFAGIRRVQQGIRELVTRRPRAYEWQVHLLVTQILGLLVNLRGLLAEPAKSVPASVARVLACVGAHPERQWRAHELARVAGISCSGLRTQFKQAQGETLREFLVRVRLEQASLRLGDPRLTCKEVARQLNFSSEYEFSHFFRRGAGISPSQFRLMTRVRRD
jgi:AraC-like DNA-binding protein